ncbi:BNR-4 repeat-containing protein [Marinoscillum sp. MHG1-6]|uniref:BNR-4 repeat-containing protein n=1 Tax=Marinoscillum sp. MHG1-6 TaxID=2959627 RepID=UPI002157E3B6|nr:BNR-4 repeat-containing protein [Marinoscillum sp. MHG1-6]
MRKLIGAFIFIIGAIWPLGLSAQVKVTELVDFARDDEWRGNPSLASDGENVYVLFTDVDRKGSVCKYSMGSGKVEWTKGIFETIGDHDPSHNDAAIAVDGDGYIHCWIGMHNDNIKYYRSVKPRDISLFQDVSFEMPNHDKARATYPWATTSANGDVFLIFRRALGANNEWQDLYHWHNAEKRWTRRIILGKFGDSAYMSSMCADSENSIHIVTAWSDFHFRDNHYQRGSYIRYDVNADKFYKADGQEVVDLPIKHDGLGVDLFYENQNPWGEIEEIQTPRITVDEQGNPIISYPYTKDDGGFWDYNVARWEDGKWNHKTVYRSGTRYGRPPLTYSNGLMRMYCTDVSEQAVDVVLNLKSKSFKVFQNAVSSDYVFAKMVTSPARVNSGKRIATDFLISRRHLYQIEYDLKKLKKWSPAKSEQRPENLLSRVLSGEVKSGFEGKGDYLIICKNGYKAAADVPGEKLAKQTILTGEENQIWKIEAISENKFSIVNKSSGEALCLIGDDTWIDAETRPLSDSENHQWMIKHSGFGYLNIVNNENGLALTPGGNHGSTDVMANITGQVLNSSYNAFNWLMVPVDQQGSPFPAEVINDESLGRIKAGNLSVEEEVGFFGSGDYLIMDKERSEVLSVKPGTVDLEVQAFNGEINQLWMINHTRRQSFPVIKNKMIVEKLIVENGNLQMACVAADTSKVDSLSIDKSGKLVFGASGENAGSEFYDIFNDKEWYIYYYGSRIPVPTAIAGGDFQGEYLIYDSISGGVLSRGLEDPGLKIGLFYGYVYHNSVWEIRYQGDNQYFLINKENQELLYYDQRNKVCRTKSYRSGEGFLWEIIPQPDGSYSLNNVSTNQSLVVFENGSTEQVGLGEPRMASWKIRK